MNNVTKYIYVSTAKGLHLALPLCRSAHFLSSISPVIETGFHTMTSDCYMSHGSHGLWHKWCRHVSAVPIGSTAINLWLGILTRMSLAVLPAWLRDHEYVRKPAASQHLENIWKPCFSSNSVKRYPKWLKVVFPASSVGVWGPYLLVISDSLRKCWYRANRAA
jgi:hypothetical protein